MREAKATHCFCGCGARVTALRLVVTNTNGWELADELGQWTKLELMWSHLSLQLSDELEENLWDGQRHWRTLRDAVHTERRADTGDETHAVAWRKHAKMARRKLGKRIRRDGMPDPFELPELTAEELTAWIMRREEPQWASELGGSADAAPSDPASDEETDCRLVVRALERSNDEPWELDPTPGKALITTADRLTSFREDYNLFLDAAFLGYWVRGTEREITGEINTVDAAYAADLRQRYAADPEETVTLAMTQVADALPAPFARGGGAWSRLLDFAVEILEERAVRLLAQKDDFDNNAEISRELREFAFCVGYGYGVTVEVLGVDGKRAPE